MLFIHIFILEKENTMLSKKELSEAIIDCIVALESVRLSRNYTIAVDEKKNIGIGKTIEVAFHSFDLENGKATMSYEFHIINDSVILFSPYTVDIDWTHSKTEHSMKQIKLFLGGKYKTDEIHHALKMLGVHGIKFNDRDSDILYHLLMDALMGKDDVLPASIKNTDIKQEEK